MLGGGMAESKKPPRSSRGSRNSIRVSRAPAAKVPEPGDRLAELEMALAKANAEIDLLRQKTDAMRADIGALRSLVVGMPASVRTRKGPPPLPIEHTTDRRSSPDIIMVDERDVTLESIRPKGR
jgi:hypothetical protein